MPLRLAVRSRDWTAGSILPELQCSLKFRLCCVWASLCRSILTEAGSFADQDLQNSLSAREFVWWYNGHPDYASLPVDLSKVRLQQVHISSLCELTEVERQGYHMNACTPCRVKVQPCKHRLATHICFGLQPVMCGHLS